MIPNEVTQNVESIGTIQTVGKFTITDKTRARILVSLSDKMYTLKQLAAIREYSTNAADAHAVVGKPVSDIIVTLPTMEDLNFSVRDFGTGLTEEQIRDIYCVFGESTKRNSNAFNGLLGYGCKAGFAVSDSFTVTSWINGEKSIYHCIKGDSEKLHSAVLLSRQKSDEPVGIKVTIPVKVDDIRTFHQSAVDFYKYWEELPTFENMSDNDFEECSNYRAVSNIFLAGNGWEIRENEFRSPRGVAYMGYVPYRIDWNVLFHKISLDASTRAIYELIQSKDVIFYFNMGEVNFVDSRENLEYTDLTIKSLQNRIYRIFNEIKTIIQEKFDEMPDLWEAMQLYNALFNPSAKVETVNKFKNKFSSFISNLRDIENALHGKITWRGIPIKGWRFEQINRFDNDTGSDINSVLHTPVTPVVYSYWKEHDRAKRYVSQSITASQEYIIIENDIKGRQHPATIARYYLFSGFNVKGVFVLNFTNKATRKAFFKEYNFDSVPVIKASKVYEIAKKWNDDNKMPVVRSSRTYVRRINVLNINEGRVDNVTTTDAELDKGGLYLDVSPSRQRRYSSQYSATVESAVSHYYINTSSVVRAVRMLNKELGLNIERIYLVTQKLRKAKWFENVFKADKWILLWGHFRTKLDQLNFQMLADTEGLSHAYYICKTAEKYLKINIKDKNSILFKILELNKIKEKNELRELLESLQDVHLWAEISNAAKDSNSTKSIVEKAKAQYPFMDWHLISSEYCSKPETLKKVATYVNAMDFYNSEMEKVAA